MRCSQRSSTTTRIQIVLIKRSHAQHRDALVSESGRSRRSAWTDLMYGDGEDSCGSLPDTFARQWVL